MEFLSQEVGSCRLVIFVTGNSGTDLGVPPTFH